MRIVCIALMCAMLAACERSADNAAGVAGQAESPAPPGEVIYNRFCFSCHAAGIAGAPKAGVPEVWRPRLAKGRAALLQSTIQGIRPGMPAMGLCMQCSEAELAAAIEYMLPAE